MTQTDYKGEIFHAQQLIEIMLIISAHYGKYFQVKLAHVSMIIYFS